MEPPSQLVLNYGALRGKTFAAAFDQLLSPALMRLDGGTEAGALEMHGSVCELISDESFVAGQVDNLSGLELLAELAVEMLGIVETDAEGDHGANIAKHGSRAGGESWAMY